MSDHEGSDPKTRNGDDMDVLLKAIRTAAREDDAAIAGFSGEVPALSREARANIADRIVALQKEGRAGDGRNVDAMAARRKRRPARAALWGGASVALAAAAWALVIWSRPPSVGADAALPPYSITATGGVVETREPAPTDGANARTAPLQHLGPHSELQITCRPDSAVTGPVAVRAFFAQSGTIDEARPDFEVAPTGAVALRLRPGALPPHDAGPGELRVVIGRPVAVSALSKPLTMTDGDGYRWLLVPLAIDK
jgi:hypothetical protein